jgi:hypothetical protein
MPTEHTSLLWLPDALRVAGLNVIELDGWKTNQQNYYWCRPDPAQPWNLNADLHDGYIGDPNGWTWHHTASSGYTPYVKNSAGQTKANLWMGLWYNGRLYHKHTSGVPTVVIASAGPANYSQGKNYRGMLVDYINKDRRYDGPQTAADTPNYYGNRYTGATEIVHPGYGEPLHPDVWYAAVVTGALLSNFYGWSAWRNHGHYDLTVRKPDPRFEKGYPYSIRPMQNEIQAMLEGDGVDPPIPPEEDDMWIRDITDETWAQLYEDGHIQGDPSVMPQYYFAAGPANDSERLNAYNKSIQSMSKASVQPTPHTHPVELVGETGGRIE